MRPNDLMLTGEDPLDTLLAFHRRIERRLAALCQLPVYLEVHGLDAGAIATANDTLAFFDEALVLHHRDEEADLMPLVAGRLGPGERGEFRDMRQRLEADHRDMDQAWRRLRRPLEAIREGAARSLPEHAAMYFRTIHAMHISMEEAVVHMLAARRLDPQDRAQLARRMHARRAAA
jgi:hemerythrin-like domain-containing protein